MNRCIFHSCNFTWGRINKEACKYMSTDLRLTWTRSEAR